MNQHSSRCCQNGDTKVICSVRALSKARDLSVLCMKDSHAFELAMPIDLKDLESFDQRCRSFSVNCPQLQFSDLSMLPERPFSTSCQQAFVNGTFIGGCQEISNLNGRGGRDRDEARETASSGSSCQLMLFRSG